MNNLSCNKILAKLNDIETGPVLVPSRRDFMDFHNHLKNLLIDHLFDFHLSGFRVKTKCGEHKLFFHVVTEDSWYRLSGFQVNCIFVDRVPFDERLLSRMRSPNQMAKIFLEYI